MEGIRMNSLRKSQAWVAAVLILATLPCFGQGGRGGQGQRELPIERIEMPEGFRIEIFAQGLRDARSLARGDQGTIFVGTRLRGRVYAIVDKDGDHKAEKTYELLEGMNSPNGVAFRDGSLYLAEVDKILRYDNIEGRLDDPPQPVVLRDDLPNIRHHGWKFIRFGPDGKLYIPIGAPCNICDSKDPRFASIARMNPDGSGFEIFAHGVRNTVGFDWHPNSRVFWFTENGRDWMGDDMPPDELNQAPRIGMHFGYPYCHGTGIPDPTFGKNRDCKGFVDPDLELSPHTAAIGMRFYTGSMFPREYRNQILIAEHGSWNRSDPIGYRVTVAYIENGKGVRWDVLAEGWLPKGGRRAWGRPVDVEVMPDGSILVSDDGAGAIYRISYSTQIE